jgi:hypothetical protein
VFLTLHFSFSETRLFLTVAVGIVVHDISLKELKIDWTPMKI